MIKTFKKIGLFAKYNDTSILETLQQLIHFLQTQSYSLTLEAQSAKLLPNTTVDIIEQAELGQKNDLIIVVGGDGSLLNAARSIAQHNTPILGINRGRLGFLADILPDEFQSRLTNILQGHYSLENRTLLQATLLRDKQTIAKACALNDCVLYTSDIARMIEFEVWINDQFMLKQRADGLIVSTPTGSTAYALSAGGPILYPTLPAFSLVPMLPHTLTCRPIVVEDTAGIKLIISPETDVLPKLSCDGQVHFDLNQSDRICIEKYPHELKLIHPKTHNYFEVLRQKLGWSAHVSSDRYHAHAE